MDQDSVKKWLTVCVCPPYQSAPHKNPETPADEGVTDHCMSHRKTQTPSHADICLTSAEHSYEFWQSLHALPASAKPQWQTRSCCTGLSRSLIERNAQCGQCASKEQVLVTITNQLIIRTYIFKYRFKPPITQKIFSKLRSFCFLNCHKMTFGL